MKTHIFKTFFFFCACSSVLNIDAENWQDLPQPIGILVRLWDTTGPLPLPPQGPPPPQPGQNIPYPPTTPIDEVNYICAQWDVNVTNLSLPFDTSTAATEIIPTQQQHYVRLYSPEAGGSINGPWFMRSSEVRGLTAAQLKDKFALPSLPTYIVNVDIAPAPDPVTGRPYAIWTGIAGPIAGFGNGGGVQNRVIADFNGTTYFSPGPPNYEFFTGVRNHPQPLTTYALAYEPMAGKGNTARIAKYLDEFVPTPYSDLENVYTALDYLNWVNYGSNPLQEALNQLSPDSYASVPFILNRNAVLFGRAFFDRKRPDPCSETNASLQLVGEYGDQRTVGEHDGFNYHTGGIIGDLSASCDDLVFGGRTSWFDSKVHWDNKRGHAHIQDIKTGVYASYDNGSFFADSNCSAGFNWVRTKRNIVFPGVARQPQSKFTGYDIDIDLQAGINLSFCNWQLTPFAELSYYFVKELPFSEHQAQSIDLKIERLTNQFLRPELGVALEKTFWIQCIAIIPQVQLAWAHDYVLDNQRIKAHIKGLGGAFFVDAFNANRSAFLPGAQLTVVLPHQLSTSVSYNAEISNHFTAQQLFFTLNYAY